MHAGRRPVVTESPGRVEEVFRDDLRVAVFAPAELRRRLFVGRPVRERRPRRRDGDETHLVGQYRPVDPGGVGVDERRLEAEHGRGPARVLGGEPETLVSLEATVAVVYEERALDDLHRVGLL